MNKKQAAGKGAEIYLEFEIEVAAGTLSNPVCLHGFDPVPLRKVCQGIQQRLEEGDRNKDTSLLLSTSLEGAHFPFNLEKICIFLSGQPVPHNYVAVYSTVA